VHNKTRQVLRLCRKMVARPREAEKNLQKLCVSFNDLGESFAMQHSGAV
jgi:hypothetical protein